MSSTTGFSSSFFPCLSAPNTIGSCFNFGHCVEHTVENTTAYQCYCSPGWQGHNCSVNTLESYGRSAVFNVRWLFVVCYFVCILLGVYFILEHWFWQGEAPRTSNTWSSTRAIQGLTFCTVASFLSLLYWVINPFFYGRSIRLLFF